MMKITHMMGFTHVGGWRVEGEGEGDAEGRAEGGGGRGSQVPRRGFPK